MVSFFSENYYIYHYSNICSNSFIFMIILILFSIFLPFFTNIGVLDKFWKPNKAYTDNPDIHFNNQQYLIQITDGNGITSDETDNPPSFEENEKVVQITGIIQNSNIHQIKFFFFFDYSIANVNFHIRSKIHIFYSSDRSMSNIMFDGDLIFKQNKGLLETYFTDKDNTENYEGDEIEKIRNDPFSRDDDYYFEYKLNTKNIEISRTATRLEYTITINKPYYQDIIVQLPNYTNLKNKWVLYSILFFPTLYVCYWLMGIVINNKIFKTRIKSDIPLKI